MTFDTVSFLNDFNIPYVDRDSILTSKYVGMSCPFCGGSERPYLGINRKTGFATCWICHSHSLYDTIKALTSITASSEIKKIMSKYGKISGWNAHEDLQTNIVRPTTINVPGDPILTPQVRKFLNKRNFSAEYVFQKYDFRSTGATGKLPYRLVLPIKYNNRIVSYTARDWSNQQEMKYMSCKTELEIVPHKEILYNIDNVHGNSVLVTEGPLDSVRIGDGSVASFGTRITLPQLMLLVNRFDNIFFCFDGGESEAQHHAWEASTIISSAGKYCEIIELDEGDPDENFQDEEELIELKKDLNLY